MKHKSDWFFERFGPKNHLNWHYIKLEVVPLAWQATEALNASKLHFCPFVYPGMLENWITLQILVSITEYLMFGLDFANIWKEYKWLTVSTEVKGIELAQPFHNIIIKILGTVIWNFKIIL